MCSAASGPLIFGKQLDARIHPAQLLRLGTWRCRAHVRRALAVFAPMQVVDRDHIESPTDLEAAADKLAAQNAGTIG